MAKRLINLGTSANKGDGDPLRTAFNKINENFNELYDGNFVDPSALNSNIIPSIDGTYDIGSLSKQWADLYVKDFIFLNGARIEVSAAGALLINGNSPEGAITNSFVGAAGEATVFYTAATTNSTIKLVVQIVGNEDGDASGNHTQACDMLIVSRYNGATYIVNSSVYGVTYTSAEPLATLDASYNSTDQLIEVTVTPTSATNSVVINSYAIEITNPL
jgi:hypothetical protein